MESTENHDNHIYNWVMFERETAEFLIRSLDFYLSLLGDETNELSQDPDLAALVTEETRREFGLGRDKGRAQRVKQWFQEELARRGDSFDIDISSLNHGTVRFIKSICFLYLAKLKIKRNKLASRPNVTRATLSAIDREISRKEEIFESQGIFKTASLIPLLARHDSNESADKAPPSIKEAELLTAVRPRPILVESIEILDHELRTRCLDLFNQFQESGQSERNDTVISEASRILENRLRVITKCGDGNTARQLASLAFNLEKPILRVSTLRAEQEAAQFLFFGTFGLIRNQVQHKLISSMPAERVLQILGLIDYLLAVISQAEKTTDTALKE